MVSSRPLINTNSAQVGRDSDGAVVFDDSSAPWVVRLWLAGAGTDTYIHRLLVDPRPGAPRITAVSLSRLPIHRMMRVARAGLGGAAGWPNEPYYGMLADEKRPGRRWDDRHWELVLQVYAWGRDTGRPGGGRQAVADLWAVSVDPTVKRWLAEARRRAGQSASPPESVQPSRA